MTLTKLEINHRYLRKNPWFDHFRHMRGRCNCDSNQNYPFYGGRGIKCLISLEETKKLWFRDKAYSMKRPSIDRINNDGNYEFSNCRFIELSKNCRKAAENTNEKKKIHRT